MERAHDLKLYRQSSAPCNWILEILTAHWTKSELNLNWILEILTTGHWIELPLLACEFCACALIVRMRFATARFGFGTCMVYAPCTVHGHVLGDFFAKNTECRTNTVTTSILRGKCARNKATALPNVYNSHSQRENSVCTTFHNKYVLK